jgi:drug/metabolite transporter (DMT)-like permease
VKDENRSSLGLGFNKADVGLLLTVLIWGVNFSVVKAALAYIPPLAFNAFRLAGATLILLLLVPLGPKTTLTRREFWQVCLLGVVGHTGYQLAFILGIHVTSAGNSALMLAMTPVMVAVIGTLIGWEKVGAGAWLGIFLSVFGVYLVMASQSSGDGLMGDLLVLLATLCWSAYTVAGRGLVGKHGPIKVTAYSMVFGTILFLPFAVPSLAGLTPHQVPWTAWAGTAFSFVFAISVAYFFWYYGVSRVGPTRTAIYSNLTPVIALGTSFLALGEDIVVEQIAGAAVILLGIHLVRSRQPAAVRSEPVERRTGRERRESAHQVRATASESESRSESAGRRRFAE